MIHYFLIERFFRNMKVVNYAYQHILPSLAWCAINSLCITLRIQTVNENRINRLRSKGKKLVYTLWHGRQFLLVRYMSRRNIGIMSSTSQDGILQANILKKFGYEVIFGSSAKSPVRALVGSIQKMRDGFDIAFAVDGPTGPVYKAKPGALFLAKKMDALIIPITFSAHPSITLKSWDEYILPKPFAHAVMFFGEPFRPSAELGEDIIHAECLFLEKTLNQISAKADSIVKRSHSI